jgi:hypothetical protein
LSAIKCETCFAPTAYVSLLDRSTMVLQFPYNFGEDAAPRQFGSGLTSQIIRTGQPLLINEDMDRNRVDEDASTIRTLTDVLETRGYQVVESNGSELVSRAVLSKPHIIILNSLLSSDEVVRALRFENGMENVLFLIYQ